MISRQALWRARNAPIARRLALSRSLSSRASTVLGALDIPADGELQGVYDGAWSGSGEVLESVCPSTGEVLARVKSVSVLYVRSLGWASYSVGRRHRRQK